MVTVIGHRGARGVRPENTIAAMRYAANHGVDMVEFDVRKTADDQLVLMHDESVDRMTDGTGTVGEMTLSELRRLDVGDGERVPTLDETLAVIDELGVAAYVEIKEAGTERRVVEAVRESEISSGYQFITGNMDILANVSAMGEPVGGGLPDITDETLRRAADLDYQHIGVRHEDVTQSLVDRIHSNGLSITAWPVNDREVAKRMAELGVEAINSDRPDIVLDALRD